MSRKGFTLMELTIVLAILAIIAGILVPLFLRTTDRARLRSDIQSATVIQNAMDLYRLERNQTVAGNTVAEQLTNLVDADYINPRTTNPQTSEVIWRICSADNIVKVDIGSVTDNNVHAVAHNLPEPERSMVLGINVSSP